MNKVAVLIPLLSTLASAADPQLRERHAAVELSLSADQRKINVSKGAVVVGATGLALSAVAAVIGGSVVASESAESLAYVAALPYATLIGARPEAPRSDGSGEALLVGGLVAGLASSVVLGIGAAALTGLTHSKEHKALEREKIVLEYQMAVERRDARLAAAASTQSSAPPSLLPQNVPPPMPAAAHLRGPLRPLDAPTR